jgi:hypothetical protein
MFDRVNQPPQTFQILVQGGAENRPLPPDDSAMAATSARAGCRQHPGAAVARGKHGVEIF